VAVDARGTEAQRGVVRGVVGGAIARKQPHIGILVLKEQTDVLGLKTLTVAYHRITT
jgi:hypothetical protein